MKLKIFSDKRYLPDKSYCSENLRYVSMLYPFWGKNPENPEDFRSVLLDRYAKIGHSFFEMTSLIEADLAVMPAYWHLIKDNEVARNLGIQFAENANQAGKQVVIFFIGDWNEDIYMKNTVIFHTSSFRSRRKRNEFTIPEWSLDFINKNLGGQLPIRQKRTKPTVGFCGYAPPLGLPLGKKKLKALLRLGADLVGVTKIFSYRTGHTTRVRALNTLSKNPLIETKFLIREHFAFSSRGLQSNRPDLVQKFRQEFQQNMIESDYILCASGYENYSLRFYETLSCGRIPVFIDTDCVLPYDFAIEWKKYCVWVDESELSLIAEKVAEFHDNLSPQEFVDLQYECRRIWEEWISPQGFFANFYRHFQM